MLKSKLFWTTWIVAVVAIIGIFGLASKSQDVSIIYSTDPELPIAISVSTIGIDAEVLNPENDSIPVLDRALQQGVVRHPASAKLGEIGNVFIFGHSSELPVVYNQNFKAFNGLGDLNPGDTIMVTSENQTHTYTVTSVRLVDANEAFISFKDVDRPTLTLSTCNSFGAPHERYVVTAIK